MLKRVMMGVMLLVFTGALFAATTVTKESVLTSSADWGKQLDAKALENVVGLYDEGAYLYATFDNMLDSREGIKQYFTKLMKHDDLKVVFDRQNVRLYGDTAINSGLYTFSYQDNGKEVKIPARFTFVYTMTPKGWKVVEHHSSILPD